MPTEIGLYKTIVYWKGEMLSFEPVLNDEVEKRIKKYQKLGFNACLYYEGLLKKIAEKSL